MTSNDLILGCSNWDAFFERVSALEEPKDKGDAFERFTQLYLQTAPKYRLRLKNVWKPDQDFGIDFLARTHQDQLWSIQAKFRSDTDSALTYKELSTFKTLSDNSENIDFCLVVHTSTKPIKNLHLLGENISTLGIDEFESIDSELWESIQSAARGHQKQLHPLTPRPHQQQAVEDIKEYFSLPLRTRGRVSMPCGSGKSLVSFWSALELKVESTVIVVPSLYLISQSIRVWSREILANRIDSDFLVICSDETTRELNTDELGGRVDELGVKVAQTVEDIKEFLSKATTKKRIVFITYQSGSKLIEASSEVGFVFDLTILDEAHKTVGYRTKKFAELMVDEKYASTRYLFMTATERVLRGKNDDILSMADSEDYGELIHQLSFRACVEADPPIISDYRVVTLATSDSRVKEFIENNPKVFDAGGEFDDVEFRDVAACLMLREFYKDFETERTISFHSSIKKAERFLLLYEKINEILGHTDIATFHISSKQSTGVRTRQVRNFTRANKALISNARCLTEGIDIPSVDSVLFADPKYSVVDIVQAAGRALRLYEGKKLGYIFLPILLPDGVEFEEYSASSEYRQVLRVIAALANQDERIVEQFQVRLLETDKRDEDKTKVVEYLGYQFAINPEQLRQQIEISISSFVGKANWRPFEEARAYMRSLNLKNYDEYTNWAFSGQRPADIPSSPARSYKSTGWLGWGDYLGTGNISNAVKGERFLHFTEARDYIRSFKFSGSKQFRKWLKSNKLPENIPAAPDIIYRNKGWINWGDWFGTGIISTREMSERWMDFEEARELVQSANLRNAKDFFDWAEKPKNIPRNPQTVYRLKGWTNWPDFLGTDTISNFEKRKLFLDFTEARELIRSKNFESKASYLRWASSDERPSEIPYHPDITYSEGGWVSYSDYLGVELVSPKDISDGFLDFESARNYVRSLHLKGQKEYSEWSKAGKRPVNIPSNPQKEYADKGWIDWGDWLGTGFVSSKTKSGKWRDFIEARDFARSLNLKRAKDYIAWSKTKKRPVDIPSNPNEAYKDRGWLGWGDWLGSTNISTRALSKRFRSFEDAKEFVRELKLRSSLEYRDWAKSPEKPDDIPSDPPSVYKNKGWISWLDWLGPKFLSFEEARAYVRGLNLKKCHEYNHWARTTQKPRDIPANPDDIYKNAGWAGWKDWLGSKPLTYAQARDIVHNLNFSCAKEYYTWANSDNRPSNFPYHPDRSYKHKGWIDWYDWLGTSRPGEDSSSSS